MNLRHIYFYLKSRSRNHLFLFYILFCSLAGCKPSVQGGAMNSEADTLKNDFLITENQVGPIQKGMTIKDLYDIYPERQVKKIKTKEELTSQASDNFYIYNAQNKLLLIVSPERRDDEASRINRIVVKDKRFVTEKGIGISSDVGQIKQAYETIDFIPSVNEIILFVPEIDANFEINKHNLSANVWNDSTGIIAANIPDGTTITAMAVFWNPGRSSIITKTFWHELLHKFTTWTIVQLPSIAILICLLIGLLRLLHFSVKRLEKIAVRRAYRAENIDNDEAGKRINTLSGILHGVGKIFLWTIFMLLLLSKFNINIAPILASAGIVGLAVGFGAQELVRDFISGFFILLEDQVRTGDVAIINGTTGTVEKIEMRTLTLRDVSGVVHIFQNGKINTLSNMTKGWSAIVLEIGVAYKEDTDRVSEVMKQVGAELQCVPDFNEVMLAPIEVLGVDRLADSAVIIKVRIKTKASQQWVVSREYLRRIKKTFDAQHIEIPFPHLSLYVGEATKPMPVKIENEGSNIENPGKAKPDKQ